jgi:hypothetical protein
MQIAFENYTILLTILNKKLKAGELQFQNHSFNPAKVIETLI